MSEQEDPILSIFDQTGARLRGHFRLTSGLHSSEYLQCAQVLQYPKWAEFLGKLLAHEFRRLDPALSIGVVAAPALQPGQYTARLTADGSTYTQPVTVKPDPRDIPGR